jgi:TPR repeat protein
MNNYVTTGPQFSLSNAELNLYEARANAGDPEAALKLSSYYGFGIGEGEEAQKAADYWYLKAAENGDIQTQDALVHTNRWQVFPKDPAKAIKFMEVAAAKGWPGATYALKEMKSAP